MSTNHSSSKSINMLNELKQLPMKARIEQWLVSCLAFFFF